MPYGKSNKVSVLKDTAVYSSATIVVQMITVILAVYIRRMLGPEAMGVWVLLQVYLTYISYFNLGVFGAVYRKIPILRGKGDEDKIESLKNSAFSYVAISSTVASLLVVIGALLFQSQLSAPIYYGLLSLAILNLLQRANNYQVSVLITDKNFSLISQFNILSAILNALFVVILVWSFHLYGLYLAMIFSYLFNFFYLFLIANLRFKFQWKKEELKELIQFGFPLVGLGLVTKLFYSLDKLIIVKFLSLTELGVYSIATMALGYIVIFPNMFHIVIYPRILEKFGEGKDQASLTKYSIVPVKLISIYFSFVLGGIWIIAPYMCNLFLPEFSRGIPALKILIVGGCLLSLFEQMNTLLLGHNRHLWTIPVMLGLSGIMFAIDRYLIHIGRGISEIALISTGGYALSYIIASFFALDRIFKRFQVIIELSKTLIPLSLNVFVLVLLDSIWRDVSIVSLMVKTILYLIWLPVILIVFDSKLSILSMVYRTFKEWRIQKESL